VPSRARLDVDRISKCGRGLGVGDELSIEGVGDAALQTAHCFAAGLAGGDLSQEVGAPGVVVAELGGGAMIRTCGWLSAG
jgi:hypothetical protein